MRFIGGQVRTFNKSTTLVRFLGLPHGLELLEGNVYDQDAPSNGELAMSGLKGMPIILVFPLNPRPPWGTLTKLQASTDH
jgi:hypothetical protein